MNEGGVGQPNRGGWPGEVLSFTALRGLAAWWVALYHFQEIVPVWGAGRRFIVKGPLAVDLFFLMSGYVIFLSNGRAFATGIGLRNALRFLCLRLARIYPLLFLMLILFISVPVVVQATGRGPVVYYEADYFLASIALVQNWPVNAGLDWNVPAWSISTEMAFYLLFPLLAWFCHRLWRRDWAWALAVAAVIVGVGAGFGGESYTGWFNPERCVPECLLGMLLFVGSRRVGVGQAGAAGLFVAAAGLVALDGLGLLLDQAAMPLAFFCLLWSLLSREFVISRMLTWRPLLWLGQVSFSTYMVHFLIKTWLKFVLVGKVPDMAVFAAYVVLVASGSVALYRFVEVPGRRAGRRWVEAVFVGDRGGMAALKGAP